MADERVSIIIDADAAAVVRESKRAERAINSLGGETRNVSRHASAFAAAQRRQAQSMAEATHAAKRATLGLGTLAAAGLGHVIKTGAEFEAQMSRVKAITNATGGEFNSLTKLAMRMGAQTKFSNSEAADAMYELASAGFKVKEMNGALKGTLALAAASNIDLADAAEISSNALRGFGLASSKSTKVADVLATAVNASSVEMTDLQLSLKYIGPIARTTGQSFEQMVAALEIMGDAGIKGEQAGTTLRGGLIRLVKPTKMVHEALRSMGLQAGDLQGPKGLKPLNQIIEILTQRSEKMTKAQRNQALASIFGTEALSGMLALVDEGAPKLDKLTKANERADGAAKKTAKTMQDNVKGAFEQLTGSIETVESALFMQFQKPLKEALLDATKEVNTKGKDLEEFFDRVFDLPEFKAAGIGGKLEVLAREIEQTGLPEQLGDLIIDAFTKAVAEIPELAAKAGFAAAKAFGAAFIETSPLGRLVLATWLLHKTGGIAAFRAMGARTGAAYGSGFAATAATGVAAGTFKQTVLANLKQLGIAGGIAAGIAFGPELVKSMKRSLSTRTAEFDLEKHARIRPLGLDLNPLEGLTDSLTSGRDRLRDFGDTFDQTFSRVQKAKDGRGLAELADQARAMGREFKDTQPAMERLALSIEDGIRGKALPAFAAMKRAGGKNMRDIVQQVNDGGFEIRQSLGADTAAGKDALARNFELAAAAVRKSMKAGEISTKTGLALIREYMGQALAQYGFSKKEAANIIAGKEFSGKSSPGGKSKTNAAHGYIGSPGAAGHDVVPLMVGEGEAVLNRHQQEVVDQALAAQGIGGLPDLFSKVNRPHYMATGGHTGQIKRVTVRSDLGTVSKVSQGAVDRARDGANQKLDGLLGAVAGLGGAGGPLPKGVAGSLAGAMALAQSMGLTITSTTGGRHAANSWHYKGRALDAAGSPAQMAAFFRAARARYGQRLLELFYDPLGGIKNGSAIGAIGGHGDHVHIALARGGFTKAAKGHLNAKVFSRTPHLPVRRGRRFKHHLPLKTLANLDSLGGQVDDLGSNVFPLLARRHALTDEQPLMTVKDPKTGEDIEVRDEGAIGTHVGELGEQRSMKVQIANLIAEQQREARRAMALLQAGIGERREALKALRERIRLNVRHIKEWQAAIKRKREEIRDLRRTLQDTGTKKGTAGRRKALRGQIRGLEDDIADLTAKITGAGDSNGRLSGQVSTKEGELRSWTDHHDNASKLSHDLPFDLEGVRIDIADLDNQIANWSGTRPPAPAIQTPDAAAGTGQDSVLVELQRQQLDEQRKALALSRAQLGVFRDFAPLAAMRVQGAFLHGGPVRQTGLGHLHAGEYVVPNPNGPTGNALTSPLNTSSAPPVINLYVSGDIGPLMGRVRAEIDGRAANVVSQQLGRRSRLIASAAGGR